MPLPGNLSTVIVQGTYLTLGDGDPAVGTITFTPQLAPGVILTDPTGAAMLVPGPIPVTLDGTGSFSIELPATDDTDLQPNGWTYLVQAQFGQTKANPYSISLPAADSPVDLKSKAPSVPVTSSVVMVRSVNGTLPDASGNVVVSGGGGGGGGSVDSVNGVSPDGSGNVTITAATVGALTQSAADARYPELSANNTLTGQFWKIGPTSYAFTPVGSQSAYLIVDRGDAADDAGIELRSLGAIKAEVGLSTTEGNLHIKAVTGSPGSETFLDAVIIENATGYVYIPERLGVGTIPAELLHIAGSAPGARILGKIENTGGVGTGFEFVGTGSVSWGIFTDIALNGGNNWGLFDNTAGYPPRLMVDSTGRVVIGSDTPGPAAASSLDVVGSINTRGINGLSGLNFCGSLTTQGAPTSGAYQVHDAVRDSAGTWWFCSSAGTPGTWVQGASGQLLTPTAVKTSAYTAVAGDYVPVDVSTSNVTVTLPTAPADKTRIGITAVALTGANAVTIAVGSGDVFNKTGGVTSWSLSTLNQGVVLQYAASTHIWYVAAGSPGPTGATGTRGSQWWFGAGAPGTVTGSIVGDQYLDINAGDIYQLS